MSTEIAFLLLALIGACSVALMAAARRAVVPDPYFDLDVPHVHERVDLWAASNLEHICWCGEELRPGCRCAVRRVHQPGCTGVRP